MLLPEQAGSWHPWHRHPLGGSPQEQGGPTPPWHGRLGPALPASGHRGVALSTTGCLARTPGTVSTSAFRARSMPAVAQAAVGAARPPCTLSEWHRLSRLPMILALNYIFYKKKNNKKNKLALFILMSCFNDCCSTSIHSNLEKLEKQFAAYRFLMRQMVTYADHTYCHRQTKCKSI